MKANVWKNALKDIQTLIFTLFLLSCQRKLSDNSVVCYRTEYVYGWLLMLGRFVY